MKPVILGIALLALGGCVSSPPPRPDLSKMTNKCDMVAAVLGDPYSAPATKMVALEVGRGHGCFGPGPTQRIELDHRIRVN